MPWQAAAEDEIRLLHTVRLHMNRKLYSNTRAAQTPITCAGSAFFQLSRNSHNKIMTPHSGGNVHAFFFSKFFCIWKKFELLSYAWLITQKITYLILYFAVPLQKSYGWFSLCGRVISLNIHEDFMGLCGTWSFFISFKNHLQHFH